MPIAERFVHQVHHPVDHQERVAMRDRVHDARDIDEPHRAVACRSPTAVRPAAVVSRPSPLSPCPSSRPLRRSRSSVSAPFRARLAHQPAHARRPRGRTPAPAAPGCRPPPRRPAHPTSPRPAHRSAPCGRSADGRSSPAWPPIMTWSSRTVEPEMPTCATITQPRPRLHVVPDLHQVVEARAGADHACHAASRGRSWCWRRPPRRPPGPRGQAAARCGIPPA